jgi:hypothetical protein
MERPEDAPQSPLVPSSAPSLGMRLLYMIVLALVFWVVCWTLAFTVLVQLVLTLLAGRPNIELARFGAGLANYSRQSIEFLTFVSDRIPFPFSEWPAP